jgi:hypothetical protein
MCHCSPGFFELSIYTVNLELLPLSVVQVHSLPGDTDSRWLLSGGTTNASFRPLVSYVYVLLVWTDARPHVLLFGPIDLIVPLSFFWAWVSCANNFSHLQICILPHLTSVPCNSDTAKQFLSQVKTKL